MPMALAPSPKFQAKEAIVPAVSGHGPVSLSSTNTVQLVLASNAIGRLALAVVGVNVKRAVGENGGGVALAELDGPENGGAPVSETVHAVIATAAARNAQRISTLFITFLIPKVA